MLDHTELIIPDVYDPDLLSAVRWLQEHLPFSDEYLAQLIGIKTELFSEWKTGARTLSDSQMQMLENLSLAINRLLSFYNFRRDLIVSVLESQFDSPIQRSRFTPPWVGTSLKDYMLSHGAEGIAEVDSWVQEIKSANC
ncbi:MAG TPA: hypothetical protein VN844_27650 [Pyrinomonadaceae bacterium]|nr:hypothetical protein [Pyrinomonadaceae bacterium]